MPLILGMQASWVVPPKADYPGTRHFVIESKALKTKVGYCVWTPPGYTDSKVRYPLIVVLHGMGGNESHDAGLYGFPPMLETAIQDKIIPPAVVLFPNGGNSGYRGAAEQMILNEVLPKVENEYRLDGRRALCGFSMGAGGASRWLLLRPDLFKVAVVWGGGPSSIQTKTDLRNSHSLWVICGEQDPARSVRSTVEKLTPKLKECRFTLLPGVGHELGTYHLLTIQDAFAFIAKNW